MPIHEYRYPNGLVLVAESMQSLETRLDEWAASLQTPMERIQSRVLIGDPVEQIANESDSFGLLVISTHGRTGLSRFLMGSVAERVVRIANCAVLVVKQ